MCMPPPSASSSSPSYLASTNNSSDVFANEDDALRNGCCKRRKKKNIPSVFSVDPVVNPQRGKSSECAQFDLPGVPQRSDEFNRRS